MVTGFLSMRNEDYLKKVVMQEYDQLKNLGVTKIDTLLITFDIYNAAHFLEFVKHLSSGSIVIGGESIKLGENIKTELEAYSHLYLQESYDFPRINLIASGTGKKLDSESIRKIEEELKVYGYKSLDELGLQWLMLPNVRGYGFDAIIDIPIYFLPISIDLGNSEVIFRAICHKALAQKLGLRVTLRRIHERDYVPIENYRLTFPIPNEEIEEVRIGQPLKSSLRKEDIVEYVVTSKIGIVVERSERVEHLLQKEILTEGFSKLISQFITLDELKKLVTEDKRVGGEIKRPDLSFQRIIVWLLSMLGFQLVELEGTAYKTLEEENGTRREIDVLMCDPQTKAMYIIDTTLRSPSDEKIDDVVNLQRLLRRRGIFVEPVIVVGEYAAEKKRNTPNVKILDSEDLQSIIDSLRRGNIEEAKKILGR
jgi:hypothetical protein